jgi:hypothetical protein
MSHFRNANYAPPSSFIRRDDNGRWQYADRHPVERRIWRTRNASLRIIAGSFLIGTSTAHGIIRAERSAHNVV